MTDILQYLEGLLASFEQQLVQVAAFPIRDAIASNLMRVWPMLVVAEDNFPLVTRCCKMVVGLLQDADSEVRLAMAAAVSGLLAS